MLSRFFAETLILRDITRLIKNFAIYRENSKFCDLLSAYLVLGDRMPDNRAMFKNGPN